MKRLFVVVSQARIFCGSVQDLGLEPGLELKKRNQDANEWHNNNKKKQNNKKPTHSKYESDKQQSNDVSLPRRALNMPSIIVKTVDTPI